MKHLLKTTLAFVGMLVVAHLALAVTPMPFADGFESSAGVTSAGYWSTNNAGGVVQKVTSTQIEGSKSLYLTTNALSLNVASGDPDYDNGWFQIWTKPGIFTDEPSDATVEKVAAAFYVNATEDLMAYSSNQWELVLDNVPTNAWLGFVVHVDYSTELWDLYVNTNGSYGDVYVRANDTPLMFTTNHVGGEMTNIVIDTELPGYIDAVAIGVGEVGQGVPVEGNALANVLTYNRYAGRASFAACPPYAYSGANAKLGGDVGDDLMQNLVMVGSPDAIHIVTTSEVVVATLNGGAWEGAGTNQTILPSTAMLVVRGAGTDTVAFYPYGTAPDAVADTIYGQTEGTGWNQKSWPAVKGTGTATAWKATLPTAAAGDMMWIYRHPLWTILKFNGSQWRKLGQTTETAFELLPGEPFWYYRAADGNITWNP